MTIYCVQNSYRCRGQWSAVDICLMLYKRHSHFEQYIKDKRYHRYSLFCLCQSDPKFLVYTWHFSVYIGIDISTTPLVPDCTDSHLSERTVVLIAQSLLDEGRHIVVIIGMYESSSRKFLAGQRKYFFFDNFLYFTIFKQLLST